MSMDAIAGAAPTAVPASGVVAAAMLLLLPVATAVGGARRSRYRSSGSSGWVYFVLCLARTHRDPTTSQGAREAVGVVFQSFHRFLGVGVGEHLGYLFTGAWTLLIGIGVRWSGTIPGWLGWAGIIVGGGLMIGSAEFLGPYEEKGWPLAGKAVPILYVLWSLWLAATGVMLFIGT